MIPKVIFTTIENAKNYSCYARNFSFLHRVLVMVSPYVTQKMKT